MTTKNSRAVTRLLVAGLGLGVALAPLLVTPGAQAASDPKYRKVSPPQVFFPVTGARTVKDMRTHTRRHPGTDIRTACGRAVFATHPGVAQVWSNSRWTSRYAVRISAGTNRLTTTSSYLSSATVTNGQIVQPGQVVGYVGKSSARAACGIDYAVKNYGVFYNPTWWLDRYVGNAPPISWLFDTPPINVASFNVLGASHTTSSRRFAVASARLPKAIGVMERYKADVVGLQEFQAPQKDQFMRLAGSTYAIHHAVRDADGWENRTDTENAIIWRKSTMELVDKGLFKIPYFYGQIRRMPWVLLKQKATGRTAYFMNTHNAADVRGPAQRYRDQAIAIEKAKMIEFRRTGRPVFLTGDFNDRERAFCPLTANKLSISPNSVPAYGCAYPRQGSIDWIFVAGQARFSFFYKDPYTQKQNISDHPWVFTRAHLQS